MRIFLELFFSFFKVGILTFGGGYAMLPILEREIVSNRKWASQEEVLNYYSIGQCTPGVISVNTATFIGYKLKGKLGAFFATLGIVTPSLIIIILIASILQNFLEIPFVINIFAGIKIAVACLILDAFLGLAKKNVKSKKDIVLACLALFLNFWILVSPVYITFVCIVFSVVRTKNELNKELK